MNIVLLSGGSGQRLWPLSNDIRSKQFIKIFHKEDGSLESMVQRVYRQIKTIDMGYTNITVVREQEQPDGSFPTCPYPNPEIKEAMALGIEYAKRCNADLMLATDPDCDRVGIAVKNHVGEYELLTGNQTGMLLLDYICNQRQKALVFWINWTNCTGCMDTV